MLSFFCSGTAFFPQVKKCLAYMCSICAFINEFKFNLMYRLFSLQKNTISNILLIITTTSEIHRKIHQNKERIQY